MAYLYDYLSKEVLKWVLWTSYKKVISLKSKNKYYFLYLIYTLETHFRGLFGIWRPRKWSNEKYFLQKPILTLFWAFGSDLDQFFVV